jgi:carbonyl reductase 1
MGRQILDNPKNLLINCCCPGWVDTDMTSHKGPLTIDEGAVTPLMVCTLPCEAGSGVFYREEKIFDWENDKYLS